MHDPRLRRTLPDQFSGSGYTFGTPHHPSSVMNPILSKRVCFYKSGDPQFNGLRMVINNRTFKTFDALLDSLSKKVPLPFGVRNITTPRGVHAVYSLDELEDGKSYICSDSRKVIPINLAVARKKPTPWYHVRPVSSRRRTVQQARLYPGHKKQEVMVMRSPKKLLVIRNGDPSVKRTVVLQKRTTPTFESILGYISELMQFNVAKLHTPEGRRVDGLPGLIMCSGIVVAVGKEKFKPANYNAQKVVGPMRSNRKGIRRLKALNRKKKSYATKPRIFSPSSERYIVNQIHNSIAEGSYSNPTNSIEMESSRYLESVAELETEHFGKEDQDCLLPQDDDIEKSFRVNQDGSMTVEMKVRLTIKEEETIQWTTTLSRSNVTNELSEDCFPVPEPEQEISLLESDQMDLPPPTATGDTINKNQNDPPSLSNGAYSEGSIQEDKHADLVTPLRTPTPKLVKTKQTSLESIKSLTVDGVQEDIIGSYRKQIENGELTEQYCTVKQTSSKPIPKPRRVGSIDAINTQNVSTCKSADMTEIMQVESSGDEVTETVMHIYEHQACQDNFLANFCAQGISTSAVTSCRPAKAETGHHSSNTDFEAEPCRPSTASESVSIWQSESISLKSDLTFPSHNTASLQSINIQPLSNENQSKKSQNKPKAKVVTKERRGSPKHKGAIKFGTRLKSPKNKLKETAKRTKVKTFSSAKFITKIYGNKPKSPKQKVRKKPNVIQSNTVKGQQGSSELRGVLIRQTSMHQDKQAQSDSNNLNDFNKPLLVPPNEASTGYVEDWLKKAHSKPPIYPEDEGKYQVDQMNLENDDPCLMSVAEKVKSLRGKSQIQNSTTAPLPPSELSRTGSVKQRIKSFEKQSAEEKSLSVTERMKSSMLNGTCYKLNQESDIDNKAASIIVQYEENSNTLSMALPPPPPAESLYTLEHGVEVSGTSSPLYQLSPVSDIHPLCTSSTSDKAISPTDHTMEMVSSIYPDDPSELGEVPLQRAPSIKKAPLVSNLSFERKMSLKKASLDKYTIPTETTAPPINTVGENALPGGLPDTLHGQLQALQSKSTILSPSCTSASPTSLSSDQRESSTSVLSSETTQEKSNEKELSSPKPILKKVKLVGSPSPERKKQHKKPASAITKGSPRLPSKNDNTADKNASPNVRRNKSTTPSASPASEKRQILPKSKLLNKPSPYSQSLDLASPPVRQKVSKKSLQRNLSSDSALETSDTKTQRKSSLKKSKQTSKSNESVHSKQNEKAIITDSSIDMKNASIEVNQEMTIQVIPQPLKTTNQPNIKPVLEKLCYSIKSIRQIIQNKRHSCLKKSNSLPDFSSHISSTFGSTSKALLAFLSVMTLKEEMPKLDVDYLNANNVSCTEALKMIDSLIEIASIDEPQTLHNSLSHLRQSASQQLLQSWRGFQEKCKSQGSSLKTVERECAKSPEQAEEIVIDEIMENLKMPEVLKKELASFSIGSNSDSEESKKNNLDVTESAHENRNVNVSAQETHLDTKDIKLQGLRIESPIEKATIKSGANMVAEQKQSILEEQRDEEMLHPPCYVELNVSKQESESSPDSESEPTIASDKETKQQMEVDETTTNTDVDEMSSSEGEELDPSNALKIIIEETLSDEKQEASETKKGGENIVNLEADSGNDHSSCDEHTSVRKTSHEESFDEKEISSEEETFVMEIYSRKESYHPVKLSEDEKIENTAKKLCDKVISQSVAERVTSLEKKVANGHRRSPSMLSLSQRKAYFVSDCEESSSESPPSQLTPCTRSDPQSSLSFSYDSSNVITKQPESNRVQSIREMFLAKSATDIQHRQGQKQKSSRNQSEIKTETSLSGGYQSQTLSELSSGEDDSSRKSISKGFVLRTIERLYGKKDSPAQVNASDRPPSAHTDKKKEQATSMFSPFHSAKSKAMSELSYFNSSHALDTLNEATRCIAFNAQVGPGDSFAIDDGRLLLHDNTALRKSVSDPVAINKNLQARSPIQEEIRVTDEKTTYLHLKTDSEDDQKSKKCTYLSLPHASDSEAGQEEAVGKSGNSVDSVVEHKNNSESSKKNAERNGKLPGMVVTEFKMTDNKVHPLVEVPPAEEVVVVQPMRGQGAINRRIQEPDMLDLLYNFCGEHCPIL